MRSSARPRLVGPTAAIFHSGDSRSSTETKVGSPPIVSRTSPAFRSASTCSPSRSRRAQESSENGFVIRGASRIRLTFISKPNSTLAKPELPQDLNQQPRRVTARSRARAKRLLRRLDARLHADDIANFLLQLRVEIDQEIDRARGLARNVRQI